MRRTNAKLLAAVGVTAMAATAHCGARSSLAPREDADGGGAPATDASACGAAETSCATWRFGRAVTIAIPEMRSPRLTALAGDCTGAWLVASGETESGARVAAILRLDASGAVQSRAKLLPIGSDFRSASLAVHFPTGRAAFLGDNGRECRIARLDGAPLDDLKYRPVEAGGGAFAVAGCRHAGASRAGFSYLAEQVRALWGIERVAVQDDGKLTSRLPLALPATVGAARDPSYERVVYDDGSYTVLWRDPRARSREALYYDASESAGGPTRLYGYSQQEEALGAVATDTGFVDAYRDGATVHLDFRDRTGQTQQRSVTRPVGSATGRGFSMTFTRGSLLTALGSGSGAPTLELAPYSTVTQRFDVATTLRLDSPVEEARMARTGDGALHVWNGGGALRAVPIRCGD